MQKLKEVKEQIGDGESNSSDDENAVRNQVDGVVAGSIPDPRVFGDQIKESNKNKFKGYKYDPQTGTITQRALDRNQKTKLIISQIDEEDENEEETIDISAPAKKDKTKVNSLVNPSPRNQLGGQSENHQQFCENQPSIDLLINKLKQLEQQ